MISFLETIIAIPVPFFILLALGLLFYPFSTKGRRFLAFAVLLMLVFSIPVVPKKLGTILYAAIPVPEKQEKFDAILVPTAGVWEDPFGRWAPGLNSLLRMKMALEAKENWPQTPLIVIGGSPEGDGPPEADVLRQNLHLAEEKIYFGNGARNSWETALELTSMRPEGRPIKKVLLVTSADHVLRMGASLRRVGIAVKALPVFERVYLNSIKAPIDYYPNGSGLSLTGIVSNEFIGIAWYWLQGHIRLQDLWYDPENSNG